jgi:hypothetical protein
VRLKETEHEYFVTGAVECATCNGTGLYVGVCEQDGAAVICRACHGTGCNVVTLQFKKFKGRRQRDNVVRVFDTSCGYKISANNVIVDNKQINFEDAGMRAIMTCKYYSNKDICWKIHEEECEKI